MDPEGLWFGIDDLVFAGFGAVIGVASQGLGDLIKGRFSGWSEYGAAAAGGALGGEALLYTANPYIAGAVGAATTEIINEYVDCGTIDWLEVEKKAGEGALFGLIKGPRISGITTGRGNYNATFKQIRTKAKNRQISSIKAKTALKMGIGAYTDAAVIDGTLYGTAIDNTILK